MPTTIAKTINPGINISSGVAIAINTLASELNELVAVQQGREPVGSPLHEPARAGDIRHSLLDPSAAAELLDWHPEVTLRDGLDRTVAWRVQGDEGT